MVSQLISLKTFAMHNVHYSTVIARSLLLVDEVMKAGMSSLKG